MKRTHCRLRRLLALWLAVLALGGSPALSPSIRVRAESAPPESAIRYAVDAGSALRLDPEDFQRFFQERFNGDSLRYVTFQTNSSLRTSNGEFYARYGGAARERFSRDSLERADFYYSDAAYGNYPLGDLTFAASERGAGATVTLDFTAHGRLENASGTLSMEIRAPEPQAEETIFYEVFPGETVTFRRDDFHVFYRRKYIGLLRYVVFPSGELSGGTLFSGARTFDADTLGDFRFYYSNSRYGDYSLESLSFTAPEGFQTPVTLFFRAYGDADGLEEQYAAGAVTIRPASHPAQSAGTVTPAPPEGPSAGTATPAPFGIPSPSVTPSPSGISSPSTVPSPFGTPFPSGTPSPSAAIPFPSATPLPSATPAPSYTPAPTAGPVRQGPILYGANYSDDLQLNASDFYQYFRRRFPGGVLDAVRFSGVPASGMLFYNYYRTSPYGSASRRQITDVNRSSLEFRFSPASEEEYSLAELTYLPVEGLNTCVGIPFTAFGTARSGQRESVEGTVLISATSVVIADVYGATPKGTAVPFPASAIASAVSAATGISPAGFRLLELPDAGVGTVRCADAALTEPPDAWPSASTAQTYAYPEGDQPLHTLRFVPEADYTGPVEIPYLALDRSGAPIGAGSFNLGIVSAMKRFRDVTSSTWCYKYVTELADAGIVGGYGDNTYQPFQPVTYGAALKLILLAAGYPEQDPAGENIFSGYLARARIEGLVSSDVDLTAYITRLQAAELAAGAMKLDTGYLSSVRPFADTDSPAVQALNDAGIFNGYFEDGVRSFRPDGNVTRGQIAAIVWRMRNYGG